jgi:hypothetical protein
MRGLAVVALVLSIQPLHGGEPRLTNEVVENVMNGRGKLSEQEVLKLVPGQFTVARTANRERDHTLTWEEVTFIEVVFINGKVAATKAQFCDTVVSMKLTLDKFKQIKPGMTQAEVEKSLDQPTEVLGTSPKTCRWKAGRRLWADIKDGRLERAGFRSPGDFQPFSFNLQTWEPYQR